MKEFIDFINDNYFLIVYGIAFICSIISYNKYFDTVLKYFPILIAYTLLNEFLGFMIGTSENYAFSEKYMFANDFIYNIYTLIFFPFFYYCYYKLNSNLKFRKVILLLGISFLIFFFLNCFFQNPFLKVYYYSIAYASGILVICILLYFLDKRESWNIRIEKKNLMFWISLGLFVFHLLFPIIFLVSFLNFELWIKFKLGAIQKILIVLMYITFSLGFIKSSRRAFR